MRPNKNESFSRFLDDFLLPDAAVKAGLIKIYTPDSEIKSGASSESRLSPLITSLEYDSRNVKTGSLYFALPGLHSDGHDFIPDSIKRGAAAVVCEKEPEKYAGKIHCIHVRNSRFAMSPLADAFYNHPSRKMGVIGVTGTEGKSTTVYLIYQLLRLLGKRAGFISTVMLGNGIDEKWNTEHQTTPEAPAIQRLLAGMAHNGAEYAVIEASSHGLSKSYNRLGDVDFDAAVMTNVNHEHLEFHGTWERYRDDKAELFRLLDASPSAHKKFIGGEEITVPSFAVVNADDKSSSFFTGVTSRKTYSFSTKGNEADLSLKLVESEKGGNRYEVFVESSGKYINLLDRLPGAFNAGNVLAALLVVSNLLSIKTEKLASEVALLKPVKGRMTAISRGQPFEVLVDYAHTPSSYESILPPLRERLDKCGGKLILLFGSPGERDTKKRAMQGEIAARFAETIILTDEDPRGEEPVSILEEIARGCEKDRGVTGAGAGHKMIRGENLFLIPDRSKAIRKAFLLAQKDDIVLLLGKGHENSIIYAKETIAYDEIGEAEKALSEMGYRT